MADTLTKKATHFFSISSEQMPPGHPGDLWESTNVRKVLKPMGIEPALMPPERPKYSVHAKSLQKRLSEAIERAKKKRRMI